MSVPTVPTFAPFTLASFADDPLYVGKSKWVTTNVVLT